MALTAYQLQQRAARLRSIRDTLIILVLIGMVGAVFYPRFSVPAPDRALSEAILEGDTQAALAAIRDGASIHRTDGAGRTPLHHAAWFGRTTVARRLIDAGADIDARDGMTGETPLHAAARGDQPDVVTLLMGHGARTSFRTHARSEACASGFRHPPGHSALDMARDSGHEEVIRRLTGE